MPHPHNTLGNDEWLLTGNSLWSENGVYEFRMQDDGKIVVYENSNPRWQNTKEQRSDVKGVRMQADGNLVIYTHNGEAVWHSDTAPKKDVILVIQNDGNLVLYEGKPVWASSTTPSA